MKKSLFLYLFILAALMNVFTYMYYSKQTAFEKEQADKYSKKLTDSLNVMSEKFADANYFSLENNENAQNYFDNQITGKFISHEKLIPLVKESLMEMNANPKGNPYIGQDQIGAQKFIINKIKVINHRWLIADFSDGEYWGEVLIKYFVNDDETIAFETMNTILYQK
jgi:hypothetical protein